MDLGFGFDATADDVPGVFPLSHDVPGPLAIDSQDPALIAAGLFRADLVLSLHDGNIPLIGKAVADAGVGAVIVPCRKTLEENIRLAEEAGISCIVADPLLQPVGSGLVGSLAAFPERLPVPDLFRGRERGGITGCRLSRYECASGRNGKRDRCIDNFYE